MLVWILGITHTINVCYYALLDLLIIELMLSCSWPAENVEDLYLCSEFINSTLWNLGDIRLAKPISYKEKVVLTICPNYEYLRFVDPFLQLLCLLYLYSHLNQRGKILVICPLNSRKNSSKKRSSKSNMKSPRSSLAGQLLASWTQEEVWVCTVKLRFIVSHPSILKEWFTIFSWLILKNTLWEWKLCKKLWLLLYTTWLL